MPSRPRPCPPPAPAGPRYGARARPCAAPDRPARGDRQRGGCRRQPTARDRGAAARAAARPGSRGIAAGRGHVGRGVHSGHPARPRSARPAARQPLVRDASPRGRAGAATAATRKPPRARPRRPRPPPNALRSRPGAGRGHRGGRRDAGARAGRPAPPRARRSRRRRPSRGQPLPPKSGNIMREVIAQLLADPRPQAEPIVVDARSEAYPDRVLPKSIPTSASERLDRADRGLIDCSPRRGDRGGIASRRARGRGRAPPGRGRGRGRHGGCRHRRRRAPRRARPLEQESGDEVGEVEAAEEAEIAHTTAVMTAAAGEGSPQVINRAPTSRSARSTAASGS